MSARISTLGRQWVPVSGGSCDLRMGYDALDQAAPLFDDAVGKARRCMVVQDASLDEGVRERLRRQLVDADFDIRWYVASIEDAGTIDEAYRLYKAMACERITGEDLCCAIGNADVISLASGVCAGWCDGVSLVAIPLNEVALLEGALIPRSLDADGLRSMVHTPASVRHVLLDYDLAYSEWESEASRYTRALMVSAAMTGSERSFSELWDNAGAIANGDEDAYTNQLVETAKRRGQTISSAAVAIRQSLEYGKTFMNALGRITENALPDSLLLAEGMRFCARVSVSQGKLSMDDMLAQDELLASLGLGEAACDIEPQKMVEEIRHELLLRGNRTMMLVPYAIGQVRYLSVSDDLLMQHCEAWCAAHSA